MCVTLTGMLVLPRVDIPASPFSQHPHYGPVLFSEGGAQG